MQYLVNARWALNRSSTSLYPYPRNAPAGTRAAELCNRGCVLARDALSQAALPDFFSNPSNHLPPTGHPTFRSVRYSCKRKALAAPHAPGAKVMQSDSRNHAQPAVAHPSRAKTAREIFLSSPSNFGSISRRPLLFFIGGKWARFSPRRPAAKNSPRLGSEIGERPWFCVSCYTLGSLTLLDSEEGHERDYPALTRVA